MTDTRKPTPVEAAVSRLVEAETALDALRKVLDKHRRNVCIVALPGGHRPETDEEVIARLATARTMVSEFVVDETGRPLGSIQGTTFGGRYMVQTDDAHGRAYAKGFWNGITYAEGRDGAVIGTPAYDRNGAKVGSDAYGAGGSGARHSTSQATPTVATGCTGAGGATSGASAADERARHESHMRTLGWEAFAAGRGRDSAPTCLPPDALNAWQGGWDGHYNAVKCRRAEKQEAVPEPPAPKPIRLRVGQTWLFPDGSERMITDLAVSPWGESSGGIDPATGLNRVHVGPNVMKVKADWTIVDTCGAVLIAGPGFVG